MRIESAIEGDYFIQVCIDGYTFTSDTKYTILELGYALYQMIEPDENWLRKNGENIPSDPEDHRSELNSGGGTFITSDPILVALAYESWWNRNDKPNPRNTPLPIPLTSEAIDIVRNRIILNEFNLKWSGFVPYLHNKTLKYE